MKAMQVVESGGGLTLIAADAQKPKPATAKYSSRCMRRE